MEQNESMKHHKAFGNQYKSFASFGQNISDWVGFLVGWWFFFKL